MNTVWISPDAELSVIPWQLFPSEKPGGSNRNAGALVRQVNSARDFIEAAGHPNDLVIPIGKRPSMLILGRLDYGPMATKEQPGGECWMPLEGTQAEGDQVEELAKAAGLKPIRLQKSDATKSKVIELLESSAFAHLATHGYFSPNLPNNLSGCSFRKAPVVTAARVKGNVGGRIPFFRSGLALSEANKSQDGEASDNYLTADDFFGLRLGGVRMIVLSACETGLGDAITGQGVLGLRTAVAASGARTLLMSLWKVPDPATQILMKEFYRGLWQNKLPSATALLNAQARLQHDPVYEAPRNWAGWILIGQ